jgi:hypothetical protein
VADKKHANRRTAKRLNRADLYAGGKIKPKIKQSRTDARQYTWNNLSFPNSKESGYEVV